VSGDYTELTTRVNGVSQLVMKKILIRTPTGAIDGVNNVFRFSPVPLDTSGFVLIWKRQDGQPVPKLERTVDYTLWDEVLTTNFIPQPGDQLFGYF
jgi:hypothetical protein